MLCWVLAVSSDVLVGCRAAPEGDKAIEGQKWQPTGSGDGPKGPKRGSYVRPTFYSLFHDCGSSSWYSA
jgi:hypothetical protein